MKSNRQLIKNRSVVAALFAAVCVMGLTQSAFAQVALELDAFFEEQPVVAGTYTTIRYELRNLGPDDAENVEFTDTLPQGLSASGDPVFFQYVDDEDSGFCTQTGTDPDAITCRPAGNAFTAPPYVLPAGETVSWTVTVFVPPTLEPGTYTNLASVSVDNAMFSITSFGGDCEVIAEADLRIQVFSYEETIATNEQGHIAIIVDNLGPSTAYNPVIRSTVISSNFVDANGCSIAVRTDGGAIDEFDCNFAMSTGIFDLGTFGANFLNPRTPAPNSPPDAEGDLGRIIITIDFTALNELTLNNTVDVVSDTFDPDTSNNLGTSITSFFEAADLEISMTETGTTVTDPGCAPVPGTPNATTAGLDANYEIEVSNVMVPSPGGNIGAPGEAEASNIVINSYIPAGARATNVRCTYDDGGPVTVEGTVGTPGDRNDPARCVIPFLPLGDSATMAVEMNVDADYHLNHGGFLVHEASVFADEVDPFLNSNTVVLSAGPDDSGIPVEAYADLTVSKTPADLLIAAGETGVYTLEVTNNGPSAAGNVTLTDELTGAAGVRMIGTTVPELEPNVCVIDPSGRNLIGDLGTLFPGETRTIWVEVAVDNTEAAGDNVALNTVTVESNTDDCDVTNNTATANVDVDPFAGTFTSDLRVTKYGKPDNIVAAGALLTYTIVVDNHGPDAAMGVTLRELIQSNGEFEIVSIDSNRAATCNSDPAADGGNPFAVPPAAGAVSSVTERYQSECVLDNPLEPIASGGAAGVGRWILTVRLRANEPQSINNVANVFSASADPMPGDNQAAVEHDVSEVANLAIAKTTDPAAEVQQGNALSYFVTVTNNGPSTAKNVVVEDRVPGGVSLISATATQGTVLTGTPGDLADPFIANFGDIASGASATLTIIVSIPPDAPLEPIKNVALTFADQYDPDNSDNVIEIFTNVVEPPPPAGQEIPEPTLPEVQVFIPLFPAYPNPVCGIGLFSSGLLTVMPVSLLLLRRGNRRNSRRSR